MQKKIPQTFLIALLMQLALFTYPLHAQTKCECASFTGEVRMKFEKFIKSGKQDDATTLVNEYKNNTDPCCQAIGYTMESMVLYAKAKIDESFSSALKAQSLLNGRYNTFASIESNRMLGIYYNRKGLPDSASFFYFKCLDQAKNENDNGLVYKIYTDISQVYINQKQFDKALDYQKKALETIRNTKDTLSTAQAYANMVTMYGRMYDETEKPGYLDSAKQLSPTALFYAKASGNPVFLIRNYLSLDKFALLNKDYDQTLKYTDTILTMVNEKTNPSFLFSLYIDRGKAFAGLKQFPPAIESLNKAAENAKLVKNKYMEKMLYEEMYNAYKGNNQNDSALLNLERYKVLSDSLLTKENADAISEMEEKYNKTVNEKKIKELAQQKRIYLLLALAGLLSVLAIAFFLRQQSLKHKKNILETEQRLNRARMNPHFFFNALTSLQKFALRENDSQALASNLSKFSNIMRETLESTYKEYVTIEQEIDFLNEYLEVQKIRFPKTFSYEISADPSLEIDELLIPAMIIQPFLENSIEHGFIGVDYPGTISAHFTTENKELTIQITDNGKGLSTTVKENNEHISRASQIIKDRIYLLNIKLKTKAGFSIDNNSSGNGVIVKIHLPLLYKDQQNA